MLLLCLVSAAPLEGCQSHRVGSSSRTENGPLAPPNRRDHGEGGESLSPPPLLLRYIQVTSGPDGSVRLSDVSTREEFSAWALALYLAMHDGTEVEDVCNTCAVMRSPAGYIFFPEVSPLVWGTEVPLESSSSTGGGGGENARCGVFGVLLVGLRVAFSNADSTISL